LLFGLPVGSVSQSEREDGSSLRVSPFANLLVDNKHSLTSARHKRTVKSASTECWKHPAEANPTQRSDPMRQADAFHSTPNSENLSRTLHHALLLAELAGKE
jgi:hypothetical protein